MILHIVIAVGLVIATVLFLAVIWRIAIEVVHEREREEWRKRHGYELKDLDI